MILQNYLLFESPNFKLILVKQPDKASFVPWCVYLLGRQGPQLIISGLALKLKTKPGPNYTHLHHFLSDCTLQISEGTLQWTGKAWGSVFEGILGVSLASHSRD